MNRAHSRAGSPLRAVVAMPDDAQITTTAQRGSLAPQRGEGLRVRGEIAQVVEINTHIFRFTDNSLFLRRILVIR